MRKIAWGLLSVSAIAFAYYLFIRPFEYEVNFKANTLPGDLIETIRIWNRSLSGAEIIEVDSFERLDQRIVMEGRSYIYSWHFFPRNDSGTDVSIRISEPERAMTNKVLIPITKQPIESDAYDIAMGFHEVLKQHLQITNVRIVGEVELKPKFCVCRTLERRQIEKANGMMSDFPVLTSFVNTFQLKPDGFPIIKVLKWNHSRGLLTFNFCFPIVRTDSLPENMPVEYKEFNEGHALKAEYHGNYITSDRAWYELIHYAQENGYKISGLPIESFHHNPNLGMGEKEWQADIYLPVVSKRVSER